jgi:hypothetical protein
MERAWVETHLHFLMNNLRPERAVADIPVFEPTEQFYNLLSEGDEEDLQVACCEISKYLKLEPAPVVQYDWGIKMEPEVAGRIMQWDCIIQIPFAYVGKKLALGAIIAHEMTHAFLFKIDLVLDDIKENEAFTDLTSIYLGLGKLILNGCITTGSDPSHLEILGYLPPESLGFAYKSVCALRSVPKKVSTTSLSPEALKIIDSRDDAG